MFHVKRDWGKDAVVCVCVWSRGGGEKRGTSDVKWIRSDAEEVAANSLQFQNRLTPAWTGVRPRDSLS